MLWNTGIIVPLAAKIVTGNNNGGGIIRRHYPYPTKIMPANGVRNPR